MKRFNYYAPSLSESWLLVATLMFGMIVIGLLFGIIWPKAPQSITYGLGMLFPLVFAFSAGGRRRKMGAAPVPVSDLHLGEISPLHFAIALFISLIALSVVIEPATAFIPMPEKIKELFARAFLDSTLPDLIISTCILAPLCEELLCRGLIMRGILDNGATPRKAILWSAAIFALIHLNPWQSIPAFAIGIFFGWVYYRSGSLWTTIALHALNNSISVVLSRIWPDMMFDQGLIDILPTGSYIVLYIASAALLFAALSTLNRKLPKLCTKSSTL